MIPSNSSVALGFHNSSSWIMLMAAQRLNFLASTGDSWPSDEAVPDLPGNLLFVDQRGENLELIVETERAVVMLSRFRRDVSCSVAAADMEDAVCALAGIQKLIPRAKRQAKLLNVTFWYHTGNGPRSYVRQLQAPAWKEISANYTQATCERLIALHSAEPTEESGKLILWQGEPGTGKTFALRALGEEWAEWCTFHYVLDPEKFFTEGDYLLNVVLGNDELPATAPGSTARPAWRLIILEDTGEMLAKNAKVEVGQGLARLLNLCDGLLGQGLRVLVLITTNEEVQELHKAVSRPGRCLSRVQFEKFDVAEGNAWLERRGRNERVSSRSTLADLYALQSGTPPTNDRQIGFNAATMAPPAPTPAPRP